MSSVRWLKRGCLLLLILDLALLMGLWLVRNPQSFGL